MNFNINIEEILVSPFTIHLDIPLSPFIRDIPMIPYPIHQSFHTQTSQNLTHVIPCHPTPPDPILLPASPIQCMKPITPTQRNATQRNAIRSMLKLKLQLSSTGDFLMLMKSEKNLETPP